MVVVTELLPTHATPSHQLFQIRLYNPAASRALVSNPIHATSCRGSLPSACSSTCVVSAGESKSNDSASSAPPLCVVCIADGSVSACGTSFHALFRRSDDTEFWGSVLRLRDEKSYWWLVTDMESVKHKVANFRQHMLEEACDGYWEMYFTADGQQGGCGVRLKCAHVICDCPVLQPIHTCRIRFFASLATAIAINLMRKLDPGTMPYMQMIARLCSNFSTTTFTNASKNFALMCAISTGMAAFSTLVAARRACAIVTTVLS